MNASPSHLALALPCCLTSRDLRNQALVSVKDHSPIRSSRVSRAGLRITGIDYAPLPGVLGHPCDHSGRLKEVNTEKPFTPFDDGTLRIDFVQRKSRLTEGPST